MGDMNGYTSTVPILSSEEIQRTEALRCATDIVTANLQAGFERDLDVVLLAEKMAAFLAGS